MTILQNAVYEWRHGTPEKNNLSLESTWYKNGGKSTDRGTGGYLEARAKAKQQGEYGAPRRRRPADGQRPSDDDFIKKYFADWDSERQKLVAQIGETKKNKYPIILMNDGGQMTLIGENNKKGDFTVLSILLECGGTDSIRGAMQVFEKQDYDLDDIKWTSNSKNGQRRLEKSVEIEIERRRIEVQKNMADLAQKSVKSFVEGNPMLSAEQNAQIQAEAKYKLELLNGINGKPGILDQIENGPKLSVTTAVLKEIAEATKPGSIEGYDVARVERIAQLLGVPSRGAAPAPVTAISQNAVPNTVSGVTPTPQPQPTMQ